MPRMVVPGPDKTGKNNCRPPGILSVADQVRVHGLADAHSRPLASWGKVISDGSAGQLSDCIVLVRRALGWQKHPLVTLILTDKTKVGSVHQNGQGAVSN